jgi:hypothetical protein
LCIGLAWWKFLGLQGEKIWMLNAMPLLVKVLVTDRDGSTVHAIFWDSESMLKGISSTSHITWMLKDKIDWNHEGKISCFTGFQDTVELKLMRELTRRQSIRSKKAEIVNYYLIYLSIYLSIYLWLYSPCGSWLLFQFLNLYTVGFLGWGSAGRKAATYTRQNKHRIKTQTSLPWVGFEPTIPVF